MQDMTRTSTRASCSTVPERQSSRRHERTGGRTSSPCGSTLTVTASSSPPGTRRSRPQPPEGTAEVADGAEDLLYWATRIAGHYMGANRAEEYGRRIGVPAELLVRVITPKVGAKKNVSD